MSAEVYRYHFVPSIAFEEVEASLVLALLATEALHGQAQVRLDAAHAVDVEKRSCVIDAGTAVGRDLNRMFAGFVTRASSARMRLKSNVSPNPTINIPKRYRHAARTTLAEQEWKRRDRGSRLPRARIGRRLSRQVRRVRGRRTTGRVPRERLPLPQTTAGTGPAAGAV